MESAQNKLDSTQDSYDNYTIKAPISGQVITKNFKVGDNITKNSSSTTVLATIYDLSSLTFEMSIDELDIKKVKVGQKVEVSADAFEGQTFSVTEPTSPAKHLARLRKLKKQKTRTEQITV